MNQNPNDPNNPGAFNTTQAPPPGYQQPPPGAYQVPPGGMPYGGYGAAQENLPNAGGILTLGILGIVFAGGIGIILSIIAVAMAGGAIGKYNQFPGRYTASSLSRVKAGRTCAIIGMCLTAVVIILVIAANA